jgi:membrane protease YdiL (CAAX protease family)
VLDITAFLADSNNPALLPALRIMQIFQAIGGFVLPPMFFAQLRTGNALEVDGVFHRPKILEILLAIIVILVSQPLINFLAEWNAGIHFPQWGGIEKWMKESEDSTTRLTEQFLEMPNWGILFLNLFMIGLLPAVGEEFLFRGSLQPLFRRMTGNAHLAIFLTAFIFSALHFQFYGFFPRLLLGIVLGYFALWSGSIWVSVAAHLFNNGAAVILSYLINHQIINKSIEKVGTEGNMNIIALSAILCVFLLRQLYIYRTKWAD